MVDLIAAPAYLLLTLYQLALVVRIILHLTEQFAPYWQPGPLVRSFGKFVFRVTDPPIRWLQSKIPPLNLGGLQLDMGFLIVFLAVLIAKMVVRSVGLA